VAALFAPRPGTWQRRAGRAALAGLPSAAAIAGVMVYNYLSAGTALPVSGLAKGGLALTQNLALFFLAIVPVTQFGDLWIGTWAAIAWRALQLAAPLAAALAWLYYYTRDRLRPAAGGRPAEAALAALCAYVLIKGGYNLAFVSLGFQGHWYYPASLMTGNLIAAMAAARALQRAGWLRLFRGATAAALVTALMIGNAYTNQKRITDYNGRLYDFWLGRQAVSRALVEGGGRGGIIDFDDGIIGYALDLPALSGIGYALDVEAHRARAAGALLPLAYGRGYRLLASVSYFDVPEGADSAQLRAILARPYFMEAERLDEWDFAVVYRDPGTGTAFIRFEPRAQGGG
jgi:hypothetical protein